MCFVILRDLPFFWPFCEAYTRNELFHFLTWFILRSQGAEYQNKSWHEFRPTSFRQKSIRLCCYLLFVGNHFEWNAVQNVIKYKLKYELIFSLFKL